jgi:hypothetical protein
MTGVRPLFAVLTFQVACLAFAAGMSAADGNRLTYLDEFCNPYYAGAALPKLVTPQWVGEPGVEAIVTLGIDDMRDPEVYEAFLRPVLDRLKQIDGRAPVSIMTLGVDPSHPRLQQWLKEGVSLETHTADHPCPCLKGGDFAAAKSTYDRCVDEMSKVPGSRPVAFRFPCMDSQNTPSPRAYAEIFNRTTPGENFLQISTSVVNVPTAGDSQLPRETTIDSKGRPRFEKYLPFKSFVNKVENYPYPFVIGRLSWEFPCAVPDDWLGQNLHGVNNPETVEDLKAAIDAAVVKQGVANFVFHPHGWIRGEQLADVVDAAVRKHGARVKFFNFRECLEQLNGNLLSGQALRAANGADNDVRILDLDGDGFMDVVIGNEQLRRTRVWRPKQGAWQESEFPVALAGVRFGVLRDRGMASFIATVEGATAIWHFDGDAWVRGVAMERGLMLGGRPLDTVRDGVDQGVRLRDVDGDGLCEFVVSNPHERGVLTWDDREKTWRPTDAGFPEYAPIVDEYGNDAGLRFVDLDGDGHDDIVFSNEQRFAVYRYDATTSGWGKPVRSGSRGDAGAVPMIVRDGTNNGAWFADGRMWVQNEDTDRLPDGVERMTFEEIIGTKPH